MTVRILIDRPSVRRAVLLWAAVFPLITLVLALTGPVIRDWPLIARTLVLTLIVVPLLSFLIMPRLMARFGRWVEAG
ncbi:hypothetical protein [uncultured Roseobacter sp.]|uniref:hypothetical protein n=1 Tax=uncultured Roseobacter sp. TaxID=114847 RepID=UPI00262B7810|nr:hypothetical protein [uncultured Roseobacter sp.]